jgi:hypothetical protein
MAANTWDDAGSKFTSGVHSNGEWQSPTGGGVQRSFFRKAAAPVRREGKIQRRCDGCGIVGPVLGECPYCN